MLRTAHSSVKIPEFDVTFQFTEAGLYPPRALVPVSPGPSRAKLAGMTAIAWSQGPLAPMMSK